MEATMDEEFFGAIKLVAFNYDPVGFMACGPSRAD